MAPKLRATRPMVRSLFADLCLFSVVANAHAECAWVLWEYSYESAKAPGLFAKIEAAGTRDECLSRAKQAADGHALQARLVGLKVIRTDNVSMTILNPDGSMNVRGRWECWPDTRGSA